LASLRPESGAPGGGAAAAIVGDDPDVCIADLLSGQTVLRLKGHRDFAFAAAWHPHGHLLATGNQDATTMVWDVRAPGAALAVLPARLGAVRALRWSGDGRWGGGSGCCWAVPTGARARPCDLSAPRHLGTVPAQARRRAPDPQAPPGALARRPPRHTLMRPPAHPPSPPTPPRPGSWSRRSPPTSSTSTTWTAVSRARSRRWTCSGRSPASPCRRAGRCCSSACRVRGGWGPSKASARGGRFGGGCGGPLAGVPLFRLRRLV
jgi:hypothetical protein